jgi:hypothetical protein
MICTLYLNKNINNKSERARSDKQQCINIVSKQLTTRYSLIVKEN